MVVEVLVDPELPADEDLNLNHTTYPQLTRVVLAPRTQWVCVRPPVAN
jgi:hypothetical protein